ncbi:MAG TPA: hypothetical protein VEC99_17610 [Clostridia bacterium]|nr:hypothetical protein [Clostridia bacterium]
MPVVVHHVDVRELLASSLRQVFGYAIGSGVCCNSVNYGEKAEGSASAERLQAAEQAFRLELE